MHARSHSQWNGSATAHRVFLSCHQSFCATYVLRAMHKMTKPAEAFIFQHRSSKDSSYSFAAFDFVLNLNNFQVLILENLKIFPNFEITLFRDGDGAFWRCDWRDWQRHCRFSSEARPPDALTAISRTAFELQLKIVRYTNSITKPPPLIRGGTHF